MRSIGMRSWSLYDYLWSRSEVRRFLSQKMSMIQLRRAELESLLKNYEIAVYRVIRTLIAKLGNLEQVNDHPELPNWFD